MPWQKSENTENIRPETVMMKDLLNGSNGICYNKRMSRVGLKPYLNKFITVTLDDGKEESGFISNPEDFKKDANDDGILVLLNGLMNAEVKVSRIVAVRESVREDTVKIPIVGYDAPLVRQDTEELPVNVNEPAKEDREESDTIQQLLKEDREESESIRQLLGDDHSADVDAAIDELFDKSFSDTMDVDVTTLLMPAVKDDDSSQE
jgi:hypothetical protein